MSVGSYATSYSAQNYAIASMQCICLASFLAHAYVATSRYNYATKSSPSHQVYYEINEKYRTTDEEAPIRPELNVIALRARKKRQHKLVSLQTGQVTNNDLLEFVVVKSKPHHIDNPADYAQRNKGNGYLQYRYKLLSCQFRYSLHAVNKNQ